MTTGKPPLRAQSADADARSRRRLRRLRRFATAPVALVAALFLAFQEWLWDPLALAMHWLARHPPMRWLETAIRALPAAAGLVAFLIPMLALLPLKIAALALIAAGHGIAGLALFVAAKVVGTALLAWVWKLTSAKLLAIAWFARAHARFIALKTTLYREIFDHPVIVAARRRLRAWREARKARRRARSAARPR